MMDVMANHATKIRRYMDKYGVDKVESFIDTVLSLDNLLDVNAEAQVSHAVGSPTALLEQMTTDMRAAFFQKWFILINTTFLWIFLIL